MKREKERNFSHSLIDDLIPTADNYCATFDFYDLILVLILSIFDFDSFVTEKFFNHKVSRFSRNECLYFDI